MLSVFMQVKGLTLDWNPDFIIFSIFKGALLVSLLSVNYIYDLFYGLWHWVWEKMPIRNRTNAPGKKIATLRFFLRLYDSLWCFFQFISGFKKIKFQNLKQFPKLLIWVKLNLNPFLTYFLICHNNPSGLSKPVKMVCVTIMITIFPHTSHFSVFLCGLGGFFDAFFHLLSNHSPCCTDYSSSITPIHYSLNITMVTFYHYLIRRPHYVLDALLSLCIPTTIFQKLTCFSCVHG